ncbi:MAG: aminoacyl-tRNA hydrolase [Oligoflexales bacterium]|nr:aminoacyl-tRNA hydrolase [Oligoflexales bacterium]
MKLIVGLGNPGAKYERTRHNAGFLMLDEVARQFEINWSGEKFKGVVGRGEINGESCVLLKPMTYMNLSGQSVALALYFFKLAPEDLVVVHDDIDVPSCKVKARLGGGDGGHKGIKSIVNEIAYSNFYRIKLGVGRPEADSKIETEAWVLGRLNEEELKALSSSMLEDVLIRFENVIKK